MLAVSSSLALLERQPCASKRLYLYYKNASSLDEKTTAISKYGILKEKKLNGVKGEGYHHKLTSVLARITPQAFAMALSLEAFLTTWDFPHLPTKLEL